MTSRTAVRLCSLVALAGAVLLAPRARVQIRVDEVDTGPLVAGLGAWKCVEIRETKTGHGGTVLSQECRYRNETGVVVRAKYLVTATRLGSLRDYAVPFEGNGWMRSESEVVFGPRIELLGEDMRFRFDTFHQGGQQLVACTWFASPRRQAHDLAAAEVRGWADLLLRGDPPIWAEVFAWAAVGEDVAATREAIEDFVGAAGPLLAELVGRGVPDGGQRAPTRLDASTAVDLSGRQHGPS